ncbi:diaminopimelate epimerase [Clostridium felsineum]|uniref:diaminopimelate epimerase n=1 Tax=Clostridium felsineum TaxID=36839 RepID=UPI00098C9DBC|nr:diaminopimelate epimerase [Clostridium felsineum]
MVSKYNLFGNKFRKDALIVEINILKCHGTGNDFILIDEYNNNYNFNDEIRRSIAIQACNRAKFIGGDGILFVQKSNICDAKMRIFNADGSEAEMCGNGLRCVGRYVIEMLKKEKVEIETLKARYWVNAQDDIYEGVKTVKIDIKSVSLNVNSLPLNYTKEKLLFDKIPQLSNEFDFTAVSITNPHLVSIVSSIDTDKLVELGEKANATKEVLPQGVNVSFVRVIEGNNIYVKTYERGVGLTKSCGTAMTASSIVSCISEKVKFDKIINVYNDGGAIKTIVHNSDEDYWVEFIGNATFVFEGTMELDGGRIDQFTIDESKFESEANAYEEFFQYTRKII